MSLTTCPGCGTDWLDEDGAHMGVDVLQLADGSREAVLLACCQHAQQGVQLHGYRAVYGQELATTLRELGCDPASVRTWEAAHGLP